jgi:glycosyltransferase involved in cell wall biosynthesis
MEEVHWSTASGGSGTYYNSDTGHNLPKPKVAVVLGNYNDSRFLINWVHKMAPQMPDELIIVDDRSTDNSVEVIKLLQKQYPVIKLVHNDGTKGCFGAFIKGCQVTDAEWVCSWGCDDEPNPGYIDSMIRAVQLYPNVDIISCNAKVVREGVAYDRILLPFDAYLSPEYMVKIYNAGLGRMINFVGMTLRKQVMLDLWEAGGKDSIADFDATFTCYMMFDKGLINLADQLITFRSYPNSWGATGDPKEKMKAIVIAKDLFSKNPAVLDRALRSNIWGAGYHWKQKIALWGIMKLPRWARMKFYKKFYSYSWRVEKL